MIIDLGGRNSKIYTERTIFDIYLEAKQVEEEKQEVGELSLWRKLLESMGFFVSLFVKLPVRRWYLGSAFTIDWILLRVASKFYI